MADQQQQAARHQQAVGKQQQAAFEQQRQDRSLTAHDRPLPRITTMTTSQGYDDKMFSACFLLP
jgi:hypothetical protein